MIYERCQREKTAKGLQDTGTYLSSWWIRKVGEVLQFIQPIVNNRERPGMSWHAMLTQTDRHWRCVSTMLPHRSVFLPWIAKLVSFATLVFSILFGFVFFTTEHLHETCLMNLSTGQARPTCPVFLSIAAFQQARLILPTSLSSACYRIDGDR